MLQQRIGKLHQDCSQLHGTPASSSSKLYVTIKCPPSRKIYQDIHQASHCFRYRTCHREGIASAMRRAVGVGYLPAQLLKGLDVKKYNMINMYSICTHMIQAKKIS